MDIQYLKDVPVRGDAFTKDGWTSVYTAKHIPDGIRDIVRITSRHFQEQPNGDMRLVGQVVVYDDIYEHVPGKGWKFKGRGKDGKITPGNEQPE